MDRLNARQWSARPVAHVGLIREGREKRLGIVLPDRPQNQPFGFINRHLMSGLALGQFVIGQLQNGLGKPFLDAGLHRPETVHGEEIVFLETGLAHSLRRPAGVGPENAISIRVQSRAIGRALLVDQLCAFDPGGTEGLLGAGFKPPTIEDGGGHGLRWLARNFFDSERSWPQAAKMSRPRGVRIGEA